ncbi:hypothetical protein DFH06DRAFT_1328437 [Mycena polygramma]|nr:hypothetical protein DFH06DRAFT_1328437 [Mycena polygramma]
MHPRRLHGGPSAGSQHLVDGQAMDFSDDGESIGCEIRSFSPIADDDVGMDSVVEGEATAGNMSLDLDDAHLGFNIRSFSTSTADISEEEVGFGAELSFQHYDSHHGQPSQDEDDDEEESVGPEIEGFSPPLANQCNSRMSSNDGEAREPVEVGKCLCDDMEDDRSIGSAMEFGSEISWAQQDQHIQDEADHESVGSEIPPLVDQYDTGINSDDDEDEASIGSELTDFGDMEDDGRWPNRPESMQQIEQPGSETSFNCDESDGVSIGSEIDLGSEISQPHHDHFEEDGDNRRSLRSEIRSFSPIADDDVGMDSAAEGEATASNMSLDLDDAHLGSNIRSFPTSTADISEEEVGFGAELSFQHYNSHHGQPSQDEDDEEEESVGPEIEGFSPPLAALETDQVMLDLHDEIVATSISHNPGQPWSTIGAPTTNMKLLVPKNSHWLSGPLSIIMWTPYRATMTPMCRIGSRVSLHLRNMKHLKVYQRCVLLRCLSGPFGNVTDSPLHIVAQVFHRPTALRRASDPSENGLLSIHCASHPSRNVLLRRFLCFTAQFLFRRMALHCASGPYRNVIDRTLRTGVQFLPHPTALHRASDPSGNMVRLLRMTTQSPPRPAALHRANHPFRNVLLRRFLCLTPQFLFRRMALHCASGPYRNVIDRTLRTDVQLLPHPTALHRASDPSRNDLLRIVRLLIITGQSLYRPTALYRASSLPTNVLLSMFRRISTPFLRRASSLSRTILISRFLCIVAPFRRPRRASSLPTNVLLSMFRRISAPFLRRASSLSRTILISRFLRIVAPFRRPRRASSLPTNVLLSMFRRISAPFLRRASSLSRTILLSLMNNVLHLPPPNVVRAEHGNNIGLPGRKPRSQKLEIASAVRELLDDLKESGALPDQVQQFERQQFPSYGPRAGALEYDTVGDMGSIWNKRLVAVTLELCSTHPLLSVVDGLDVRRALQTNLRHRRSLFIRRALNRDLDPALAEQKRIALNRYNRVYHRHENRLSGLSFYAHEPSVEQNFKLMKEMDPAIHSEDESCGGGQFIARHPAWRSRAPVVKDFFQVPDVLSFASHFRKVGCEGRLPGQLPAIRTHLAATSDIADSRIPVGLPQNMYDEQWLRRYKEEEPLLYGALKIQPPIDLRKIKFSGPVMQLVEQTRHSEIGAQRMVGK